MGSLGAAIDLVDLGCKFGVWTGVDRINTRVPAGELVAIVGPSGCGKSTLLRLIAGLQTPTCGHVAIDGVKISDRPAHSSDVGFVFQDLSLYPHFTVRKNLQFSLRSQKLSRDELDRAVSEVAEVLGIGQLLGRYPADLSGGEKQRVAIGRAIVRRPSMLLLDEPLSQLDSHLRVCLRDELLALQRRVGATTIYVTHDSSEALAIADRVLVMRAGGIVQDGTPEQVYVQPDSQWVAEFFGSPAINIFPAEIRQQQLVIAGTSVSSVVFTENVDGPVHVGVRPSDIELSADAADLWTCRALVRRVYRRDDRFGVWLEMNLGRCEAIVREDHLPHVDAEVVIGVSPKSMLIFDVKTGSRIDQKFS